MQTCYLPVSRDSFTQDEILTEEHADRVQLPPREEKVSGTFLGLVLRKGGVPQNKWVIEGCFL